MGLFGDALVVLGEWLLLRFWVPGTIADNEADIRDGEGREERVDGQGSGKKKSGE